jgi:DNA-directed RNA polymerase subunit beta
MKTTAIHNGRFQELDDEDVELEIHDSDGMMSPSANMIPLANNVQAPRLFYGARFFHQTVPLVGAEAPLVRPEADDGISHEEKLGERMGAVRARLGGVVKSVTPDSMIITGDDGEDHEIELYNRFPFNRKSEIHNEAVVAEGDRVEEGSLLAKSNFTDDKGHTALGRNARIGLVPYKGYSMDDAIVISEDFANKLTSRQSYTDFKEFDGEVKGGKTHFTGLFPTKYTQDQLRHLDDEGVAKPGTVLQQGDPYILATQPKMITSSQTHLGKLTRAMQHTRQDASMIWEHEEPATVVDAVHTKKGAKVMLSTETPAKLGDKIVFRPGNKHIVSKILPREHMPRTADGEPLEVLVNHLSLPSRVNANLVYEALLGKVAKLKGEPRLVRSFDVDSPRYQQVVDALAEAGISDVEEVFDPQENRKLESPITVGTAFVQKLHHLAESKMSARGQGSYDMQQQPLTGGSEAAQAKRLSGLESHSLMSAGAYETLREAATIRGTQNDEYWRALRSGRTPREPGAPFAWDKFQALIAGAGMYAKNLGDGRLRMGPMTDRELKKRKPLEIKNGQMLDLNSMEPIAGGLFDPVLVGGGRWGEIPLDEPVPNPVYEDKIAALLGVTKKNLLRVLAGDVNLEEVRK